MARKSMVELQADLLTSFPDNITGLITPQVLRDYFNSVIEAIRPAYGVISRPNATIQQLGVADAPIIFDTGFVSDVPDYTTSPATGLITRLAAGATRLTFNCTIEAANGRLVSFTVYKNGAATAWKGSVTAQGAGKPVDVSINTLNYDGASAGYQLHGKANAAATGVTFSNMDMLAESVPVNAY